MTVNALAPRERRALEAEGALERNLEAVRAPATRRAYRAAWLRFARFARSRGESALPGEPYLVALYLSALGESGVSVATVRLHSSAIATTHEEAGLPSPTRDAGVRRMLAGHAHRKGGPPAQARALDAPAFETLCAAAGAPRPGRGGRMESKARAETRAALDIALVALMRDALLRRSEAAALDWEDLRRESNGTGRVVIRRSKTDRAGATATRWFSPRTARALHAHGWRDAGSVFGLSASQVCRRIAAAAVAGGLGAGYSGHSPRVGMVIDLVRAGYSNEQIKLAGRWKTEEMVSWYARNELAARGAVAHWYEENTDAG